MIDPSHRPPDGRPPGWPAPGSVAAPPVVAWLGYGGLAPFLGLALASWLDPAHRVAWHDALIAYAAVILSFVGALHWGFATTSSDRSRNGMFLWSVVPSLLAWLALLLHSFAADALLIAGFAAHFWRDRRIDPGMKLPAWYLPLRFRLSAVAIGCLLLAAVVQQTA